MPVNSFDGYPLSWRPEREGLSRPYYKSLAADLEEKIRSGILRPGTLLPPQREIADYLDLNYTTITRVYDQCRKKGLIYGIGGKGTFVAPHAGEAVSIAAGRSATACVELGALNGFGEHSLLVEKATREVVERGYLRQLYQYSGPQGHPHQLSAGERWLHGLGVHAHMEDMAILPGAQNALTVALMSLFSPGDRIAVDEYTYSNFLELARLLHLVPVPVKGDGRGLLPQELESQCRSMKLAGVYLIPTYSNPTTITMPLERRRELAGTISRLGLTLIEDDIATWMGAAEGRVLPSLFDLLEGDSVYICGTTKSLCPGLRLAYMAFPRRLKEALLHGLTNVDIMSSPFDGEVITQLILSGDAYKIAEEKLALARRSAQIFASVFPGSCPEGPGYFKWLPIPSVRSPLELERELGERGAHIYHSVRFTLLPSPEREYLRVSLCSAGSPQRLDQGLKALRQYLEQLG